MNWVTLIAIYFVVWWLVLFLVLPFGVRSQVEENDVTLGTEHGAPAKHRLPHKMLATTLVSLVVVAILYVLVVVMGVSFDDFPRIVPNYSAVS